MLKPRRDVDDHVDDVHDDVHDHHDVPDEAPIDEAQIRADERAAVERELRTLDERRDERRRADPDADDGVLIGERHDRVVGDDRRVIHRDVADDVVVDDRPEEIEVVRTRAFSFGQLLTLLVGAALVVLGVFALIETGLETPLDQPIEQVMGYDHAPLLGISEVVAGGLLVLFSLRPGGRWFVAVVGLVLVVAGVMILGELDWTADELGAEQGYAWIPIVAGLVALLSSLLTPRRYQRMTGVPSRRLA